MVKKFGFSLSKTLYSYNYAKRMQKEYDIQKLKIQYQKLAKNYNKNNILIVAHPYISNDKYIGTEIKNYLEKLGANVLFADINRSKVKSQDTYLNVSKSIYWKPSINLINGIKEYENFIDGIIYLTVFPCGVDSLVNELLIRKIKSVPSINLILDEQEIGAGIYTRLESFFDILDTRRNLKKVSE